MNKKTMSTILLICISNLIISMDSQKVDDNKTIVPQQLHMDEEIGWKDGCKNLWKGKCFSNPYQDEECTNKRKWVSGIATGVTALCLFIKCAHCGSSWCTDDSVTCGQACTEAWSNNWDYKTRMDFCCTLFTVAQNYSVGLGALTAAGSWAPCFAQDSCCCDCTFKTPIKENKCKAVWPCSVCSKAYRDKDCNWTRKDYANGGVVGTAIGLLTKGLTSTISSCFCGDSCKDSCSVAWTGGNDCTTACNGINTGCQWCQTGYLIGTCLLTGCAYAPCWDKNWRKQMCNKKKNNALEKQQIELEENN